MCEKFGATLGSVTYLQGDFDVIADDYSNLYDDGQISDKIRVGYRLEGFRGQFFTSLTPNRTVQVPMSALGGENTFYDSGYNSANIVA